MADEKLIFPIGFDLEEGVKEASKEWKNTYQKQLQKAIDDKPLKAKIELETKGLDLEALKEFNKISKESVKAAQANAKIQKANIQVTERQRIADERVAAAHERTLAATNRRLVAEERLTQAKQRSARATTAQNEAYKTQSSYLQRLTQRMIAYASITQAFSFLRNIRDVTAEFELQRVALGSIIGDLNEANAMFEQIKAAAVKSPFQIKELVTYTKQLAAYKIETDELFETTQRLADVSAGLGVGMERLVLAYGQIRATGYLRASEVRQLTEAGIPIVEELAKKMSDLRGETVSAAEVMGMISERAISFGMVKEVFEDMTSAGGMFYKMQEKQAETLAGQWSNLQDSISIMYDEIGNTERVNNAIKGMIGLIKSLAENWRDVKSAVEAVTAGVLVYMAATKNATIASKAMTVAEIARTKAIQSQNVLVPKLIANIVGETNAKKLSTIASRTLYKARVAEASATGLVSKALAKLKIALLKNPYTALVAVLATVIGYFAIFKDRVVQADDAIKGINSSLSEFERHATATDDLMERYNRLAGTTNRTAKEQKEYQETLNELGKMYPDAIEGMDKYGNVLDLNVERLAEASTLQREFNRDLAETQIQLAESLIPKLEEEIEDAKNALGKRFFSYWGNYSKEWKLGLFSGDKDQTELLDMIASMREEIEKLKKSADEARKKLAGITEKGDGKNLSDTFNTWQKELASITEGKNLKGEGIRLFDDESISQINKLTDATARVAEEYDKLAKEKKEVDKALKSEGAKADKDTYAKLQERLGKINEGMSGLYDFLKKYGALDLIKSDDKTQKSAEQALKDELATVEKIYKRYQDLRKLKSETDTQSILAKEFKGVSLTTLSKAYSPKQMIEVYQKALAEAQRLGEKDLVLEIQTKIGEFNVAEEQRELEKKLKELSDQISRTKTAKEFFDRMLGLTDNKQLSATLTLSVYGTTGDDLKSALVKQVEDAFKGVDISGAIDYNTMTINYQKLAEIYAKNQDKILDANKSMAESIVKDGQKTSASQIEQWAKELEAVKTYADKRVDIARQTQQRISEVEASTLPEDEKRRLQEQYRKKEEKDLAKLEYQSFKESPMYVAMFDNLDSASTAMLNNMRAKLMELKEAWGGLDMPTELKEMQSRLNEIDKQLASRNPFKTLANAYKGYQELLEQGSRKEAEQDLIDKTARHAKEVAILNENIKEATRYQQAYDDAVAKYGKDSVQARTAEAQLYIANSVVETQKDSVNTTEESVEASQELVNKWKELDDVVGGAWEQADMLTQAIINLGRNLADAFGGFGSEADAEYFNTMLDSFSNLSSGITSIGKGIAMGDPIAIINGIGSAISGLAGLFTAGKVRKANKEIERQQDLIDKLEKSHEKLEKQTEETFGSDYLKNYNDRLANLYAQQEAYLKQAEAERSKGKKEDKEKTQGYLDSASDVAEQIADMQAEVSERFSGTDLASAARDFAQSWIDAYKEFGSTTDAMKDKFHDMIQNMVVESIAGKMMQELLRPVFEDIEKYTKDSELDEREIADIADMSIGLIDAMDEGMTGIVERLRAAGYNIRQSTSGLTGISKDIASASEESILGLSAGINTQNFYISQVPPKLDIIIGLLQGGNLAQGSAITLQDLVTIQNQHLSYLPSIAQHTADTVAECKQIVAETRRTADALERVIKPRGTQATHTVNTSL